MHWWTGKTEDGYGYISMRGEKEDEHAALNRLYHPDGYYLDIEQGEDEGGVYHTITVKRADFDTPPPPSSGEDEIDKMDKSDLQTKCAELGISVGKNDRRGDLIRKLRKHSDHASDDSA